MRNSGSRVRTKAFVAPSMDGGQTFATVERELTNLTSAGVLPDGGLLVLATPN